MIIAQFNEYHTVSDNYVNTFIFYDTLARLHRIGDSYFDRRSDSYKQLLNNQNQQNKNTFRLHFIME